MTECKAGPYKPERVPPRQYGPDRRWKRILCIISFSAIDEVLAAEPGHVRMIADRLAFIDLLRERNLRDQHMPLIYQAPDGRLVPIYCDYSLRTLKDLPFIILEEDPGAPPAALSNDELDHATRMLAKDFQPAIEDIPEPVRSMARRLKCGCWTVRTVILANPEDDSRTVEWLNVSACYPHALELAKAVMKARMDIPCALSPLCPEDRPESQSKTLIKRGK